jgi:hypothetical protein
MTSHITVFNRTEWLFGYSVSVVGTKLLRQLTNLDGWIADMLNLGAVVCVVKGFSQLALLRNPGRLHLSELPSVQTPPSERNANNWPPTSIEIRISLVLNLDALKYACWKR